MPNRGITLKSLSISKTYRVLTKCGAIDQNESKLAFIDSEIKRTESISVMFEYPQCGDSVCRYCVDVRLHYCIFQLNWMCNVKRMHATQNNSMHKMVILRKNLTMGLSIQALKPNPQSGFNVVSRELQTPQRLRGLHCWTGSYVLSDAA